MEGIVCVVLREDGWDLNDPMVGVTLVLVLLAYGRFRRQTVASRSGVVAVGAIWAFCLAPIVGFTIDGFQVWLG